MGRTVNGSHPQAGGETSLRIGSGKATKAQPGQSNASSTGIKAMPGQNKGKTMPTSGKR